MAAHQKIPWNSIGVAFVLFVMFFVTGNDRYAIAIPAVVIVGMFIERRKSNQPFGRRSMIGYAFDAYIMVAVALGLLGLGANLILSPSAIRPRWMLVLGVSVIPLGIALISYAIRYFMMGRRNLNRSRDEQP